MSISETADESQADWSDAFARAIDHGRRRALELLDEQQRRIDRLEAQLAVEIDELLATAHDHNAPEAQARREQLAADIGRREAMLAEQQSNLAERERDIESRESKLRESERTQSGIEQILTDDKHDLARARERLERDRDELATQRAELANQRAELAGARAAAELQRRRIAQAQDRMGRAARGDRAPQARAQASFRRPSRTTSGEPHVGPRRARGRARESQRLRQLLGRRMAELRSLRREARSTPRRQTVAEIQPAAEQHRGPNEIESPFANGRVNDILATEHALAARERLVEDRMRLEYEAEHADFCQKFDDLQRRFEMAIADLRQYKQRNADLESQIDAKSESEPSGSALDWESRKQQLLSTLESTPENEEATAARITIEGTIRITDEVIAQKDREIAELKSVLAQQSCNLGSVAVGAATIAGMLDADELIRHERERLERMQEECTQKSRVAEVEISVERARLARAWADLEDRLASARPAEPAEPASNAANQPPAGQRRWWAFLGLKETSGGD